MDGYSSTLNHTEYLYIMYIHRKNLTKRNYRVTINLAVKCYKTVIHH